MYCCHKNSSVTYCIAATIAQCNSSNKQFLESIEGENVAKTKNYCNMKKAVVAACPYRMLPCVWDLSMKYDFLS